MLKTLLWETAALIAGAPVIAASDESIHVLNSAKVYLLKVNNRNTRRYEICSINKDTETTLHNVFIDIVLTDNFEQISDLALVILLLTLNRQILTG